jgi:hypothetical protein
VIRRAQPTLDQRRAVDDLLRHDIERWLLRRGAPHFIEGYRASTNVWTRAFPALILLWTIGLMIEVRLVDDIGGLALIAALIVVVSLWVASNVVRRRKAFALPKTISKVEVAFFVVTPGVLSFALDRQVDRAFTSIASGAVLVLVVYLVTSYGIVPLTLYVLRNLRDQTRLIAKLSSRAIPLLLLITMSVFLTGETWQMSNRLAGVSQAATLGLFVVVGGVFLLSRVPAEVAAVEHFHEWAEVHEAIQETAAEPVRLPDRGDPLEPPRSRGQRTNLVVMALAAQAVQITLVAFAVYSFFVLLGTLAIHPDTAEQFIGEPPNVYLSISLGRSTFALSEELLRVAGFLAAFSGLAFTVYLVTDSTYRDEFTSDVGKELRDVMAVRLAYLHHLHHPAEPRGSGAPKGQESHEGPWQSRLRQRQLRGIKRYGSSWGNSRDD